MRIPGVALRSAIGTNPHITAATTSTATTGNHRATLKRTNSPDDRGTVV